jgi:excisionase family DNA binding protein
MSAKKKTESVATRVLQERSAPDDELLRMREVAAILRCSVAQSYRLVNAGDIPAFRVRGMVRTPRAQLMAFIAKNSSGGSAS